MKKLFAAAAALALATAAAAQWDPTKPPTGGALNSAEIRANWAAIEKTVGGVNLLADYSFLIWPAGDTSSPAHWTYVAGSGTGAALARTGTGLGDTNRKHGSFAAKIIGGSTGVSTLTQNILPTADYDDGFDGQVISAGAWLRAGATSACSIRIDDGAATTSSAFVSSANTWEWITVTRTISASATKIAFFLRAETGQTCYISGATALFGAVPPKYPQASPAVYTTIHRNQAGTVTTGTRKQPDFTLPRPFIVRRVNLWVSVAPTGQALIVDVNHWDNSVFQSMYSTRPQIAASSTTGGANPDGTYRYRCFLGQTGGTQTDLLGTWDIDQVGSGAAGTDLNVAIEVLYYARPLEGILGQLSSN